MKHRMILILASLLLATGVATAAPPDNATGVAIKGALKNYYQAIHTGQWAAIEPTLYLPDAITRDATKKQYETLFAVAKQKIASVKVRTMSLSPSGQIAEVRLRITGTMIRADGKENFPVDRELVALLRRTPAGWKVISTQPALAYDAQRREQKLRRDAETIRQTTQLAWMKKATQKPPLAKKAVLSKSLQIRLAARVEGTPDVLLPQGTILDAGDVVVSAPAPTLKAQLAQAMAALELAREKQGQVLESRRKGKATQEAVNQAQQITIQSQQAMEALTKRQVLSMISTPLPGTLAALLTKRGASLQPGAPVAGLLAETPDQALCFLRLGDQERMTLLQAGQPLAPEQYLYALKMLGNPVTTLYAKPIAILEDPASNDLDVVLAIDAKEIPAGQLGAVTGIELFLPPKNLRNPAFPPTQYGYGVILKNIPIDANWLTQKQKKPMPTPAPVPTTTPPVATAVRWVPMMGPGQVYLLKVPASWANAPTNSKEMIQHLTPKSKELPLIMVFEQTLEATLTAAQVLEVMNKPNNPLTKTAITPARVVSIGLDAAMGDFTGTATGHAVRTRALYFMLGKKLYIVFGVALKDNDAGWATVQEAVASLRTLSNAKPTPPTPTTVPPKSVPPKPPTPPVQPPVPGSITPPPPINPSDPITPPPPISQTPTATTPTTPSRRQAGRLVSPDGTFSLAAPATWGPKANATPGLLQCITPKGKDAPLVMIFAKPLAKTLTQQQMLDVMTQTKDNALMNLALGKPKPLAIGAIAATNDYLGESNRQAVRVRALFFQIDKTLYLAFGVADAKDKDGWAAVSDVTSSIRAAGFVAPKPITPPISQPGQPTPGQPGQPAGPAGPAQPGQPGQTAQVNNFTLPLPAGWVTQAASRRDPNAISSWASQDGQAEIWILRRDSRVTDLKKYAKSFDKRTKNLYPFIDDDEDSDKVTIAGKQARFQEYEGKLGRHDIIAHALIIPDGQQVYIVMGLYRDKQKKTVGKTVRNAIMQFRLKK